MEHNKIVVKKCLRDKDGIMSVKYEESIPQGDPTKEPLVLSRDDTPHWPVHKDMMNALHALREHYVRIMFPSWKITDNNRDSVLQPFTVTGYVIKEFGEEEQVQLIGINTISAGRVTSMLAPFTGWKDDIHYADMKTVKKLIQKCGDEAVKYLGGKRAPDVQQNLFEKADKEAVTA